VVNGDKNHCGVVQTAGRIGQFDQAFGGVLRFLFAANDFEDFGRFHSSSESIRAEKHSVFPYQRDFSKSNVHSVVDPQGAGDDVLLRRALGLLFGEQTPADLLRHQ